MSRSVGISAWISLCFATWLTATLAWGASDGLPQTLVEAADVVARSGALDADDRASDRAEVPQAPTDLDVVASKAPDTEERRELSDAPPKGGRALAFVPLEAWELPERSSLRCVVPEAPPGRHAAGAIRSRGPPRA